VVERVLVLRLSVGLGVERTPGVRLFAQVVHLIRDFGVFAQTRHDVGVAEVLFHRIVRKGLFVCMTVVLPGAFCIGVYVAVVVVYGTRVPLNGVGGP